MIKVIELVKRPLSMSLEQCHAHWRERHGEIVARLPGLRRYVQSHTLPGGYRSGELAYDGIAELWFDDKDGLRTATSGPEFDAAKADEANFSDDDQLVELVVDTHVIKDGVASGTEAAGPVKSIALVRFRRDLDPDEARAYWREVHGPIAAGIPQLRRYVQNHVRPGAYRDGGRPPWDGAAITWFDSLDDMRQAATTDELAATRADEPNLLAAGGTPVLLTTELVVVDGPGD